MQHVIEFTKASGAGNDFVLIDNMDDRLQLDKVTLAHVLCSRRFGIGADGLLLLEPSVKADFFMRYHNADGSYGGMCGNGGRCVARYAYIHGIARSPMTFVALDHVYQAVMIGNDVKLRMKNPIDYRASIDISLKDKVFSGSFINTGSPHVVIFQERMEDFDVEGIGKEIRHNALFLPDGTNVNVVRPLSSGAIEIRTYERGVECETLACGTGAVASAIVSAYEKQLSSPVHVKVRSGEELLVHFEMNKGNAREVHLQGSAHFLFSGRLVYDSEMNSLVADESRASIRLSGASP